MVVGRRGGGGGEKGEGKEGRREGGRSYGEVQRRTTQKKNTKDPINGKRIENRIDNRYTSLLFSHSISRPVPPKQNKTKK